MLPVPSRSRQWPRSSGTAPVRALRDDDVRRKCEPPLHCEGEQSGTPGSTEAVDFLLKWGADRSKLNSDGKTAAEVVGDSVFPDKTSADDVKRVHELLAAERAWRRRGLLLLCRARDQAMTRRRGDSWE